MTIYYEDELTRLHLGSCMEELEWNEYGEVLISDPPYGIAYKNRAGNVIANDESVDLRDEVMRTWNAVARPWLVFGSWKAPRPEGVKQMLIWDKGNSPGMGDCQTAFGLSHEDIYIGGTRWEASGVWKRRSSVIRTESIAALAKATGHPTPKPPELMDVIVASSPAGIIAEPFAGSGGTVIAARKAGRQCIAVELEERYCEVIAKRIEAMKGLVAA